MIRECESALSALARYIGIAVDMETKVNQPFL